MPLFSHLDFGDRVVKRMLKNYWSGVGPQKDLHIRMEPKKCSILF